MKKVIVIIVLVLCIFVVPYSHGIYKDGGTETYTSLTYKIVKWKSLVGDDSIFEKESIYFFPDNFKSLGELWELEKDNVEYIHPIEGR